jgi:putative flippase GtrA
MSIAREGSSFLAIGLLLVVIDWAVFVACTYWGVAPAPANVAGRVTGALLGFIANGVITFRQPKLNAARFIRFIVLWMILTVLSTALVTSVSRIGLSFAWLAKPMVELALAIVSFMASRHWVYR